MNSPSLRVEHFIEWANWGARPMVPFLFSCDNVSDEGLVLFLVKENKRLTKFHAVNCNKIGKATWKMVIERCLRIAECSGGSKFGLKDMAMAKLFNKEASFNF